MSLRKLVIKLAIMGLDAVTQVKQLRCPKETVKLRIKYSCRNDELFVCVWDHEDEYAEVRDHFVEEVSGDRWNGRQFTRELGYRVLAGFGDKARKRGDVEKSRYYWQEARRFYWTGGES